MVPLFLYTQHTQQSTEKEKEKSEYANNKASKAILFFGLADFYLMHVVKNHRDKNLWCGY